MNPEIENYAYIYFNIAGASDLHRTGQWPKALAVLDETLSFFPADHTAHPLQVDALIQRGLLLHTTHQGSQFDGGKAAVHELNHAIEMAMEFQDPLRHVFARSSLVHVLSDLPVFDASETKSLRRKEITNLQDVSFHQLPDKTDISLTADLIRMHYLVAYAHYNVANQLPDKALARIGQAEEPLQRLLDLDKNKPQFQEFKAQQLVIVKYPFFQEHFLRILT